MDAGARNVYTPNSLDPVLDDELLTVSEVASLLKVPASWVYDRTRRRSMDRLPHIKIGKYLRFRRSDVHHWIEDRRGI